MNDSICIKSLLPRELEELLAQMGEQKYRAKQIFRVKRMIVVTQTYHMYRALYDCSENHITALGVGADQQRYSGQLVRDVREVPARLKDFILVQMEEPPKLGGEVIPITGSGVISHGE